MKYFKSEPIETDTIFIFKCTAANFIIINNKLSEVRQLKYSIII